MMFTTCVQGFWNGGFCDPVINGYAVLYMYFSSRMVTNLLVKLY